jgi:hypothetical protein
VDLDDPVGLDETRRRAAPLVDGVHQRGLRVLAFEHADRHQPQPTLAVPLPHRELARERRRSWFGQPRSTADGGRDERPEDGERRHRVAGEADVRRLLCPRRTAGVESADEHRLARLHRDPVEEEVAALLDDAVDDVHGGGGGRP